MDDKPGPHGTPIRYIAPKSVNPEDLRTTFNETPGIMEWLEKRTGLPLPFKEDKYFQICTPYIGLGSAMEYVQCLIPLMNLET